MTGRVYQGHSTIQAAVADAMAQLRDAEERLAVVALALTAPDRVDTLEWVTEAPVTFGGTLGGFSMWPRSLACRVARARHEP